MVGSNTWSQKHSRINHIQWYKNLRKKNLFVAKHVWNEFSWHTSCDSVVLTLQCGGKFLMPLLVILKQFMMHVCSYMTSIKTTYLFEFVFMISVINAILWNIWLCQVNLIYVRLFRMYLVNKNRGANLDSQWMQVVVWLHTKKSKTRIQCILTK